jgi:hypothetical protein
MSAVQILWLKTASLNNAVLHALAKVELSDLNCFYVAFKKRSLTLEAGAGLNPVKNTVRTSKKTVLQYKD